MRKFKAHLWPPNNHQFTDRTGFVHTADNWGDLEAKVIDYRKRNNFPPGDVHEEIITQVCAGVPSLCYDDTPLHLMKTDNWNATATAWLNYAAGLKRSGFWPRVHDEEAQRRATICSTCPAQKALTSSCGACVKTIDGMRQALFDGCFPLHRNLGICGLTGEDCQTIVHIELPKNHDPKMPAHCWRKP